MRTVQPGYMLALALAAGCWTATAPRPISNETAGSTAAPAGPPARAAGPREIPAEADGGDGDRDGDGIIDVNDKCTDEPEDFDGYQDEDGCPEPDNDLDGVADVDDHCPNHPEDRDGVRDDDGCAEP